MDYSQYEGADIIHDLNKPVTTDLANRFDVVIDGGSLEHVFNFPTAIASLMTMVRIGGRLFMTTPANNLCGHGMYQFSPELMFRIFAPENGFEMIHLQLVEARFPSVELTRNRRIYEVSDPAKVERRVGFISDRPVMMMVEARKFASVPLFVQPPLQSDYVSNWARIDVRASTTSTQTSLREIAQGVFSLLPSSLQMRIRGYLELRRFSLANRRHFRRL
jgi:SAM-dependent methyltransferase